MWKTVAREGEPRRVVLRDWCKLRVMGLKKTQKKSTVFDENNPDEIQKTSDSSTQRTNEGRPVN